MKKSHTICLTVFTVLLLALSVTTGANANSKVKVKDYTLYKTRSLRYPKMNIMIGLSRVPLKALIKPKL